jgi:hypothetical protein
MISTDIAWGSFLHLFFAILIGGTIGIILSVISIVFHEKKILRYIPAAIVNVFAGVFIIPLVGLLRAKFFSDTLIIGISALVPALIFFSCFQSFYLRRYQRLKAYGHTANVSCLKIINVLFLYLPAPLLEALRTSLALCFASVLSLEYYLDVRNTLGNSIRNKLGTSKDLWPEIIIIFLLTILPALICWVFERKLWKKWNLGSIKGLAHAVTITRNWDAESTVTNLFIGSIFCYFLLWFIPAQGDNNLSENYQIFFHLKLSNDEVRCLGDYAKEFGILVFFLLIVIFFVAIVSLIMNFFGQKYRMCCSLFDISTSIFQSLPIIVWIVLFQKTSLKCLNSGVFPALLLTAIMLLATLYKLIRDELKKIGSSMNCFKRASQEPGREDKRLFFALWKHSFGKNFLFLIPMLLTNSLLITFFYHVSFGGLFYHIAPTGNSYAGFGFIISSLMILSLVVPSFIFKICSKQGLPFSKACLKK